MSRSGARNTRHLRPFDSLLTRPAATLGESVSVALPCSGVVGVERGGASGLATDEESSAAVRSSGAAPSVTATCVRISEIYLTTDAGGPRVHSACAAKCDKHNSGGGSRRGTHPYRHISAESADGSTDLYHVSVLTCAAADRVSTPLDWAVFCATVATALHAWVCCASES